MCPYCGGAMDPVETVSGSCYCKCQDCGARLDPEQCVDGPSGSPDNPVRGASTMLRILIICIGLSVIATACGSITPIDRDHWDNAVVGSENGASAGN